MGLRTGIEYLNALRDKRHIVYDGKRVDDVTTEPGFRNTAHAVAQYYRFSEFAGSTRSCHLRNPGWRSRTSFFC